MIYNQLVPNHLVKSSPFPIILSFNIFAIVIAIVLIFNSITHIYYIIIAIITVIISLLQWLSDIYVEATLLGCHSNYLVIRINYAFILFIWSELSLFTSILIAYIDYTLSNYLLIANTVSPFTIPLLGSAILFSSSISITVSHFSLIAGIRIIAINYLIITIIKAVYFTLLQLFEYKLLDFTIRDNLYGSLFYIATGLHGSHILLGTLSLIISIILITNYIPSNANHTGFKLTIIYWHFVDAIWAIIYSIIYLWPAYILN